MKKIFALLTIIACCMAATPAQAQLLKFGLKGGVNLSKIDWKSVEATKKNTTGFFVGPMVELNVPLIGIGADAAVMYSKRGDATMILDGGNFTVKQEGIEVPVNLKYTIGLGDLFGIFIAAGPDFFFNFKDNKWNNSLGDLWKDKKMQVGLNLGAGVKLFKHLQVGVNYQLPLGDSFTLENAVDAFKIKTNTWQASLAYTF
jgi:opacity protein-like surface antigen